MLKVNREKLFVLSRNILPRSSGSSVVIDNLCSGIDDYDVFVFGERHFENTHDESVGVSSVNYKYITLSWNTGVYVTKMLRIVQFLPGLLLLLVHYLIHRPKKILIVYPSREYLLKGLLLVLTFGVDCHLYYHNLYVEHEQGYKKYFAVLIQRLAFKKSRVIFLISKGMQDYFQTEYPFTVNQTTILRHSHVKLECEKVEVKKLSSRVKVAFAGNVNASNRSATDIAFKALGRMALLEFHIFSTSVTSTYLTKLGINENQVIRYPVLERQEFLQSLNSCDFMLLTHGFSGELPREEYLTIFPTKTIEYLFTAKPIFYVGSDDVFLSSFLRANRVAHVVTKPDQEVIRREFELLLKRPDVCSNYVKNAAKTQRLYERENVQKVFLSNLI